MVSSPTLSPRASQHVARKRRPIGRAFTALLGIGIMLLVLPNFALSNPAGASTTTIFGEAMTPGVASTLSLPVASYNTGGVAFDANGDLFISNMGSNTITVLPASSGTLFGQAVTAGVTTQLMPAVGIDDPFAIAFDSNGDLFVANNANSTITVLPALTGTIFGQAVTANVATTLTAATGLSEPAGLAFDGSGDLFISNIGNETVSVLPSSTGTIFGQAVTADIATTLTAAAGLTEPAGIAVDASGDLFVAEVNTSTITVLPALTGTIFGQAVSANVATTLSAAAGLSSPYGVAFDASGDLFIANTFGDTITMIPVTTGTLFGQAVTANTATTLAAVSTGLSEPYGMAFDANGNLFISNGGYNEITEVTSVTAYSANVATILASATGLSDPYAVTLDANGDLFIANSNDNTISVIPASNGTIFGQTVTAGQQTILDAATGLSSPTNLAFDPNGDLFISNNGDNTVTMIPASTGTLFGEAVTANQAATLYAASNLQSFGFAFDASGDLFFANINSNTVSVIPVSNGTIFGQTVSANVVSILAAGTGLNTPAALAMDASGNLFIANIGNNTVSVIPASNGTIFGQTVSANVATTLTAATGLSNPEGLAFDASGDLFITNHDTGTASVVPAAAGTIFGQPVSPNVATTVATGLGDAFGAALDAAGDLFSSDVGAGTITVVAANSGPLFGQAVTASDLDTMTLGVNDPMGMAFDGNGDLFISNGGFQGVTMVPAVTGTIFGQAVTTNVPTQLTATAGFLSPYGLAFDAHGDLFIANFNTNSVAVLTSTNETIFGQAIPAGVATTLTAATGLSGPYGIAVDARGDLLISSTGNNTITVLPASTGTLFGQAVTANVAATLAAATGLDQPAGIAVDAHGDLYAVNSGNNTITVLPASTGTLFGQAVTANVATTLDAATGGADAGVSLDSSGDLYTVNNTSNTINVLPANSGVLFGQAVTANASTTLAAATGLDAPESAAFDASGDLFVTSFDNSSVTVVPALSMSGGPGSGSAATPSSPSVASTISLAVPRDALSALRGKSLTLTATLSVPGSVAFFDNGAAIAGCSEVSTTTTATCEWTPSRQGANTLVATLVPTLSNEHASASLVEHIMVIGVPGRPSIKRMKSERTRVTVVETRLATSGGSPILGYQYNLDGVWHNVKITKAHRFSLTGLKAEATYRLRLRARNRAGYGTASNLVLVRLVS